MPYFAPRIVSARGNTDSYRAYGAEPAFGPAIRWTLRVLAWLAFSIAGYLAWHAVSQTSVAGCGMGSANGCDVVLSSSWSKWLGVPVAVIGLGCYATLATLSIFLGIRDTTINRWVTTAFVLLSVVAAGASIWFIGVQVFAIHDYCRYCLVADACGIALGAIATAFGVRSALASRHLPQAPQPGLLGRRSATTAPWVVPAAMASSPPVMSLALAGAIPILVLLIGGQLLFATKTYEIDKVALTNPIQLENTTATEHVALRPTDGAAQTGDDAAAQPHSFLEPDSTDVSPKNGNAGTESPAPVEPQRQRPIKLLNGMLTLDVYQHPVIGSREAPHIAVEMVSYDCPHCREMHGTMKEALSRYGDQVALLVMCVPFEKACNKEITDEANSHKGACHTAKLGLGIAKLNPPLFTRFHDFLMTGADKPPAMEKIIPKAYGLVDRDRLREVMRAPETDKQIAGYVELFAQLAKKNRKNKDFGLPLQILGDHVMAGQVEKKEDVFKAWEEYLGVKPK